MPGVHEQVREAVEAIGAWLVHSPNPGEAIVRQAIVLRLLHAAGFDIWNPAEVVPEDPNPAGKRADLMIQAGDGRFALELKGMNIHLQPVDYQQAVAYAAHKSTRWALLTNGRIWVVLDRMHNPGGTFQDHEVLKLELNQEGQTFAEDLADLLDAGMWRANACADAVQHIAHRQQQRLDAARILKEKTPLVQTFQREHDIGSFGSAVELATRLGTITEAERDVLLGVAAQKAVPPTSPAQPRRQPPTPMLQPHQETPQSGGAAEEIHFTYRILGAEANAVYRPADGSWTVKAGSTALNRLLGEDGTNAKGVSARRQSGLHNGQLVKRSAALLEYASDVIYRSASTAAIDIAGASRNGWECWKDSQGRLAQHYRPEKPSSD